MDLSIFLSDVLNNGRALLIEPLLKPPSVAARSHEPEVLWGDPPAFEVLSHDVHRRLNTEFPLYQQRYHSTCAQRKFKLELLWTPCSTFLIAPCIVFSATPRIVAISLRDIPLQYRCTVCLRLSCCNLARQLVPVFFFHVKHFGVENNSIFICRSYSWYRNFETLRLILIRIHSEINIELAQFFRRLFCLSQAASADSLNRPGGGMNCPPGAIHISFNAYP